MFKRLLSVGGFTLLSRITGFVRDVLMAWILGKGVLSDAFIVAFLFPNYFRQIFGEGTINPAFLPRYAALRAKGEYRPAELFGDRVFAWQMIAQLVILVLALVFMPAISRVFARGFADYPGQLALPVAERRLDDQVFQVLDTVHDRPQRLVGRDQRLDLVQFPPADVAGAGLAAEGDRQLARGVLGPAVGVAGSWAALEAIKILVGEPPQAELARFDLWNGERQFLHPIERSLRLPLPFKLAQCLSVTSFPICPECGRCAQYRLKPFRDIVSDSRLS